MDHSAYFHFNLENVEARWIIALIGEGEKIMFCKQYRMLLTNGSLGIVASLLAMSSSAHAADVQQEVTPEAANSAVGEGDIIVTARRRAESIQAVPVAVTALSGVQLARQGIANIEQLRQSVPALTVAPSNFGGYTPSYTIRAQRQGDGIITQDQSVGVYFSDVVQARPNGTNQSLYDIQSVQVVKGPQGTLFGRNTTGGALLITPNRPTDKFEGNLTATAGNYNLLGLAGVINIPVATGFALRIAATHQDRNGYVQNITTGKYQNDDHTTGLRISALIDLSPAIQNLTVFDYFRGTNGGTAQRIVSVNPLGSIKAIPALVTALQAALAAQQARSDYVVANDGATFNNTRVWGVANTTTFNIGFGTIKNIFGYRSVKTDAATDWDGSPALAFHNENVLKEHQISDELQLLGASSDKRFNYILGAYIFRETGHEFQPAYTLSPNLASREGDVVNASKSVFAQIDYEIVKHLTVTAGLRQTWDDRDLTSYNHDTAPGGPQLGRCRMFADDAGTIRLDPCVRVNPTARFNALTYTAGLNYKITSDIMVYATHNKGYRAGGQQFRANRPSETVPFAPEVVKNYEVGFKGEFFDRRARLNIAAYKSDYTNIQRLLAPPCPAPNQTFVCSGIANAALATIKGFEIETLLKPATWLDLQGFYSVADAKYAKFVTPQGLDLSSKAFAGVPKTTYGLTVGVNIPADKSVGDFRVSVSYFHQSKITFSDDNDEGSPGYGLVNLGAQWNNVMGKPIDLRFYMNNVANKSYATAGIGIFPSFGFTSYQIGDPRNWGLSATYRF